MTIQRVHVIGGAGSGKTTLAKAYTAKFGIPHHELDNFYYTEVAARKRREKDQRDKLLKQSVATDQWVLEGIFWQPWIQPSLERAEKIIVLAIPESTRHYRVITRHFRYLAKAEAREYRFFFPTLFELLNNNRSYNTGPLKETLELLSKFDDKVSVCTSNSEASRALGL